MLEKRAQQTDEKFEDFYTDLLLIVKSVGFCEADKQKLVRNAIALHSADKEVRTKCLEKGSELTLQEAVDLGRRYDASKVAVRIQEAKTTDEDTSVHAMKASTNKPKWKEQPKYKPKRRCGRCGHSAKHRKTGGKCQALGIQCSKCSKPDHFAKMCQAAVSRQRSMEGRNILTK